MAAQKVTSKETQKGKQPKRNRKAPAKTQTAITKRRKPSAFPFFKLPAELRNMIYHYSLVDTNGIYLVSKSKAYRRVVKRRLLPEYSYPPVQPADGASPSERPPANQFLNNYLTPQLLCASRQVYDEAAPMLYTQNALFVEDTTCLHTLLAQTGRERARIADVTIQAWGAGRGVHNAMNHVAFMMLADAVGLRRLHLDCVAGWWATADKAALQFYRDAHYWLEAAGARAGDMAAGVDVISLPEPREESSAESNWNSLPYYRRWSGFKNTQENHEKFREELVRLLKRTRE